MIIIIIIIIKNNNNKKQKCDPMSIFKHQRAQDERVRAGELGASQTHFWRHNIVSVNEAPNDPRPQSSQHEEYVNLVTSKIKKTQRVTYIHIIKSTP